MLLLGFAIRPIIQGPRQLPPSRLQPEDRTAHLKVQTSSVEHHAWPHVGLGIWELTYLFEIMLNVSSLNMILLRTRCRGERGQVLGLGGGFRAQALRAVLLGLMGGA